MSEKVIKFEIQQKWPFFRPKRKEKKKQLKIGPIPRVP